MKRRLLTIGHSYAVRVNRRLAHEFSRVGKDDWEITAIAPRHFQGTRDLRAVSLQMADDEPCRVDGIRAYMTGRIHCFWYGAALRRHLAQPWHLVHCWEEPYILAGWQIAGWTRPSSRLVIVTAQNWSKHYPPPFRWTERSVLRRSSGWVHFGKTIETALIDRPGYRERPHRLIPMGVDCQHFQPSQPDKLAVRQGLGWQPDGPPVVGFLGRFTPEKGVSLLTRILDRMRLEWRALFVGAGPLEGELRKWATRHGNRVRICNNVGHDDVPRYLNAMDVLCAPSQTTPTWREQFGRMLVEAFACGVPVMGSDSGEIPYVIEDAGDIVPEADESAWEAALGQLLESPSRRFELASRGRQRAIAKFDWPVIARQHLDFFEELL
jgi:glycosyltransferase involved in cell wall biosynthesis